MTVNCKCLMCYSCASVYRVHTVTLLDLEKKNCDLFRESSFNMTRGGDEDIEGGL